MPIKRTIVCSLLAAALLVVAPLQATTTRKSHGKTTVAAPARHHNAVHATTSHHASKRPRHGKVAAARHRSAKHLPQVATGASATRFPTTRPAATLPGFGVLGATAGVIAPQPTSLVALQPARALPLFHPTPLLAQAAAPVNAWSQPASSELPANVVDSAVAEHEQADGDNTSPAMDGVQSVTDLRKALIAMAMKLRDIRYVRGGRDPSTGFDCSGFVRYVFAHAVGMQLPNNSASQFLAGLKVKRADMKPGDLVFFHTHGKRRISHVGIYISNGRFIHSPTTGKSVEISSLDSGYWAKRFAGAKRPEAMAQVAGKG
ncbi:C40 family peptidase [Rhodanobacter umsongensis]|uniref:C40 family peptidase n=1 Tax=Rhodanobacter umsongensis TaxID=633153 RepID=A0ABW0JHX6_9GAMM